MKPVTFEAVAKDGRITLLEDVRLPEHARVYVVVPGEEGPRGVTIGSPRLAEPGRAGDFAKLVTEDVDDRGEG